MGLSLNPAPGEGWGNNCQGQNGVILNPRGIAVGEGKIIAILGGEPLPLRA